jgi:hypothetical protein
LFAAIDIPIPLPSIRMPTSALPFATARATGAAKSG